METGQLFKILHIVKRGDTMTSRAYCIKNGESHSKENKDKIARSLFESNLSRREKEVNHDPRTM